MLLLLLHVTLSPLLATVVRPCVIFYDDDDDDGRCAAAWNYFCSRGIIPTASNVEMPARAKRNFRFEWSFRNDFHPISWNH
jgi:hypothetical protein